MSNELKDIDIENHTYHLFDDIVNTKIFDSKKNNPDMHKMGPRGPKHYMLSDQFYSKNARKLRFHILLHFNARKHMILSFYLNWTEFTRNCEFVSI